MYPSTGHIYGLVPIHPGPAPKFKVGQSVRVMAGAYRSETTSIEGVYPTQMGYTYRLNKGALWYKEQALEPVPVPPVKLGCLGWGLVLFSVWLATETIRFLF